MVREMLPFGLTLACYAMVRCAIKRQTRAKSNLLRRSHPMLLNELGNPYSVCLYVCVTGFVQSLTKLCGLNWMTPDYTGRFVEDK